jgi:serine/threonine-protein kinase HipA
MAQSERLDLWLGDELVGTLHDTSPMSFEYATGWLASDEPMAVAAIALQAGRIDSAAVRAFFENLLPGGELRDVVAQQRQASSLFSLLLAVAGDTAGGFVIVPGGQTPTRASYEPTTWEALGALLREKSAAAIDIQGKGARVSLAGAQDKTGIAIWGDGVPRLPKGTSPSSHILKPNIKRLHKVWHSAANETIVMLAAAHCGLPTAEVFYEPHTQSCVVRRFDRVPRLDGSLMRLGRLVQYDLCQLAGVVSDKKYESEGGPGVVLCAELIRRYSTQAALDLRHFIAWIFFNLYVGNNDSHAKNLSLYRVPGHGVALAPFYDLMCTRLYPGLSPNFAFAIGGETKPGRVTSAHVAEMARELGMRPQFVVQQARELAAKMPDAISQAVETVKPLLPSGARVMAGRLQDFVLSTTKKTAARLLR